MPARKRHASEAIVVVFTGLLAALRAERGQGLAEYGLMLSLVAIVAILALIFLGGSVSGLLTSSGQAV